jgi:hypothetical protein
MDHSEFMPLVKKVWDQNLGGLSNVSVVLQTQKAKAGIETF